MKFHVPLRLVSLPNERLHWAALLRVKKLHHEMTLAAMSGLVLPQPPLLITITRIGARRLDDDNLSAACKFVRDAIASKVGLDDGSPHYAWRYTQRVDRRRRFGVDVEIVSR